MPPPLRPPPTVAEGGRARAAATSSAPTARTAASAGVGRRNATPAARSASHSSRRDPRPKSVARGQAARPHAWQTSNAPPRAMSAADSGTESGAVSHAPAATMLNRQKRIGAVAHSAASAAANPDQSHSGREGSRARIGSEKAPIPQTAANVSSVPTEKRVEGAPRNRTSAESPIACAAPIGRSRSRVARNVPTTRPARTAGGFAPPTRTKKSTERSSTRSRRLPSTPASPRSASTRPASSTTCNPETTRRWYRPPRRYRATIPRSSSEVRPRSSAASGPRTSRS